MSSENHAVHPLVAERRMMVVPGVYDVLSAKIAERAGFPAVVLTGYGLAASHLGEPDVGLLTQTEVLETARRVTAAVAIGVIVDGDTGYGGPLNVQRMVRELVAMGARGVLLEDQCWPKRCGHMRGKEVIPAEEHAAKIRAAVDARGDTPFVITARTDALETDGLDEAIRRARLYKEAGATLLFVEGPRTKQELRRIGAELPPPLVVNLIEGGARRSARWRSWRRWASSAWASCSRASTPPRAPSTRPTARSAAPAARRRCETACWASRSSTRSSVWTSASPRTSATAPEPAPARAR